MPRLLVEVWMLGHNGRVLQILPEFLKVLVLGADGVAEEVLTVLVNGRQQFVGEDERMGNHLGAPCIGHLHPVEGTRS